MGFLKKNYEILKLIEQGRVGEALEAFPDFLESIRCKIPSDIEIDNYFIGSILLKSRFNELKRRHISKRLTDEERTRGIDEISHDLVERIMSLIRLAKEPIPQVTTKIKIDENFDSFSDEEKLEFLSVLSKILNISEIFLRKAERGCVLLTVDIPVDKYQDLIECLKKGKLDELKVIQIDNHERITFFDKEENVKKFFKHRNENVFVSGLSYKVNENVLLKLFQKAGMVDSVELFKFGSKNYAAIAMPFEKDVIKAVNYLDEKELDGHPLKVWRIKDAIFRTSGNRSNNSSKISNPLPK